MTAEMFTLPDPELDELIEAFETHRESDADVSVDRFFPEPNHPRFTEFVVELLRVDLEHTWNEGRRDQLHRYVELYPAILDDAKQFGLLAFEEYRLRAQAEEAPDREAYARDYGVDVSEWPDLSGSSAGSHHRSYVGSRNGSRSSRHRLRLEDRIDFPRAGDHRDGFHYVSEIGRGSFSRVFLARQDQLADRLVVLKVSCERWNESDLLARLQHTNIVPIYSVHRLQDYQIVCMPYLGCCTLADVIRSLFPVDSEAAPLPNSGAALISTVANRASETQTASLVPEPTPQNVPANARLLDGPVARQLQQLSYVEATLWMMTEVASGLRHAHQLAVVHSDLKPANILITDDGRPMLLDFNLSDDLLGGTGQSERVGGTLPYMAVEHLQGLVGDSRPDRTSDIFSFGVVLYELLTGKRPFAEHHGPLDQVVAQMIADRRQPFRPIRELNPAVPRSVEAIVQRCLAPDTRLRYQSVDELLEDLQRQLRHEPLRFAPDRSLRERAAKWARRHPRASSASSVLLASCVLIASLLGAGYVQQRHWARVEAESIRQQFATEYAAARLALSVPEVVPAKLSEGRAAALRPLAMYGVGPLGSEQPRWDPPPHFRRLTPADQNQLRPQLAELAQLIAWSYEKQARWPDDTASQTSGAASPLAAETARTAPKETAAEIGADQPDLQQLADAWQRTQQQLHQPHSLHPSGSSSMTVEPSPLDDYLEGLQAYEQGQYRRAVDLIGRSLKSQPQDFAAWFALGNAHAALREFDAAVECFSSCFALRPDAWVAVHQRGLCRYHAKQYGHAEKDFQLAAEMAPHEAAPRINWALTKQQQGDWEAAARLLKPLAEGRAPSTRVLLMYARVLDSLGRVSDAQTLRTTAMQMEPLDEEDWIARGMAHLPADPQAALHDLDQALVLNPHSYVALRNAAYVLSDRLGRIAEAIERLDHILDLHPNDAEIIASRGVLRARADQHDLAREEARRALAVADDAQTRIHVACIYSLTSKNQADDAQQAMKLLREGLRKDPSWVEVLRRDADLRPLQDRDDFQQLMAAAVRLMQAPVELHVKQP